MLYIIFLQQIHVVHVTVRFILLQLQLQAFYTPSRVLVEYRHSLIINPSLGMDQEIHPSRAISIHNANDEKMLDHD